MQAASGRIQTGVMRLFFHRRSPLDEAFAMVQEGEQWVILMLGGQSALAVD